MTKSKIIYLILGPKGAGKTTLCNLIEKEFKIKYVSTEKVAIEKFGREVTLNDDKLKDIFNEVKFQIVKELKNSNSVCFDSTGVFHGFDELYSALKNKYIVKIIRLYASKDICSERVIGRGFKEEHIKFTDEETNEVYDKVENLDLAFEIIFDTETDSPADIINKLKAFFTRENK